MSYADSHDAIRNDMFELMANDSSQPINFPPLVDRQHADSSMIDGTVPSGSLPQDAYRGVRTESSTKDTAMMDSMDGVAATEPTTADTIVMDGHPSSKLTQNVQDGSVATKFLTTDTVMMDDQPTSKLSQNIKDDSLATDFSTKLATTDDELFADFLVENVDDFVALEPSPVLELPRVPYFPHSNHRKLRAPTRAIPILKRQQFVLLMTEEMVRWLASLETAHVRPATKRVLIDPFLLEVNRHAQNSFNKFLAKHPHLPSTSQYYMDARHQFWHARGGKAELAPSARDAELYAWTAAPEAVPAPSTALTADLEQARKMLLIKPDPRPTIRRLMANVISFNAENDAARRNNAANNHGAAAAAAGMMPPPPRPTRRNNPAAAAQIPRPVFAHLHPALLPNSHIDNMSYNLWNGVAEAKHMLARALAALETEDGYRALVLCARLAVDRMEFAAYWPEQEIQ